jgi:clan AA aspartic protease (TIGR02281 family)
MLRRGGDVALGIACAGVCLALGGDVRAEIYKWTDASGQLHFSQSLDQVPPAKREAALRAAKAPKGPDPLQVYSAPSGARPAARNGTFTAGNSRLSGRSLRIPFERHGTLMKVDVLLNGRVKAPFYIDTGASGVSIPWAVAQQLGIAITPSTPRVQARTANGLISEPLITLDSVQLGPARVTNLKTAVSSSMNIGLLGGAFFNNFVYQVDSAASVITLTPNQHVRGGLDKGQWLERFQAIRQPLDRLEAYIEKGGFMDKGRVRELEAHRGKLRGALEELEQQANSAGVPQGWRR